MPSNIPVAPKSQYEIERDERIKRNEAFILSIGIDPHGGGYMKQNKKKAPPKPRLPRKRVRAVDELTDAAARGARRLQHGRLRGVRAPASFMNVVRYHRLMYTQVDGAHTSAGARGVTS